MRLALPDNSIEIAIEDEETSETAYVQISTDGRVEVQDAAGEKHAVELGDDLRLADD